MKNQNGYTLIELLIVTAIIGILAATALPQFYPFKTRAYDADAKANLHNVFLSCKGFWALNSSNNPCLLNTVSNTEYGFVQSAAVEVALGNNNNNTEFDFYAESSHIWSSNVYVIDYRGVITRSSSSSVGSGGSGGSSSGGAGSGGSGSSGGGGSGGGGSGSGGAGNKNKGCSEEAQSTENKGKDFGKSAKGGCA